MNPTAYREVVWDMKVIILFYSNLVTIFHSKIDFHKTKKNPFSPPTPTTTSAYKINILFSLMKFHRNAVQSARQFSIYASLMQLPSMLI